ncbi:MAG: hypothetical protein ACHQAX_05895 [Gammaproteobacteria bacterium]
MPSQLFNVLKDDFDELFNNTLPVNHPFWLKMACLIILEQETIGSPELYEGYLAGYLDLYAQHPMNEQTASVIIDLGNLMTLSDVLRTVSTKCDNPKVADRITGDMIAHWQRILSINEMSGKEKKVANQMLAKIKEKCRVSGGVFINQQDNVFGLLAMHLNFYMILRSPKSDYEVLLRWFDGHREQAELFMTWICQSTLRDFTKVIVKLKEFNQKYWGDIHRKVIRLSLAQAKNAAAGATPAPVMAPPPADVVVHDMSLTPLEKEAVDKEMRYLLYPSRIPKDYNATVLGRVVDLLFTMHEKSIHKDKDLDAFKAKRGLTAIIEDDEKPLISALKFFNENGEEVSAVEAVLLTSVLTSAQKASLIIGMLIDEPGLAFFTKKNQQTNIFELAGANALFKHYPDEFEQACMLFLLRSNNVEVSSKMARWLGDETVSKHADIRDDLVTWFFEKCRTELWATSLWKMLSEPAQVHLGISALVHLKEFDLVFKRFVEWLINNKKSQSNFAVGKVYFPNDKRMPVVKQVLDAIFWAYEEHFYQESKKDPDAHDAPSRDLALARLWRVTPAERDLQVKAALMGGIARGAIAGVMCETYLDDGCIPLQDLLSFAKSTTLPMGKYFAASAWNSLDENTYKRLKLALALGEKVESVLAMGKNKLDLSSEKAKILLGLKESTQVQNSDLEGEMAYLFDAPIPTHAYFKSFSEEDLSFMENDGLTETEKARRIVYLTLTEPTALFYRKENVKTNIWQDEASRRMMNACHPSLMNQTILSILLSDDEAAREEMIDWLGCETYPDTEALREDFYKWYMLDGLCIVSENNLNQKWVKTTWALLSSQHISTVIHILAFFANKPETTSKFFKTLFKRSDINTEGYHIDMVTRLHVYKNPALPVDKALECMHLIYWLAMQIEYEARPEESGRDRYLAMLWKLPNKDRVIEMKVALKAGIPAFDMALTLGNAYCSDDKLTLDDLKYINDNVNLPFVHFISQTVWMRGDLIEKRLEAAFALGAKLSDVLSAKNQPIEIPAATLGKFIKLIDRYKLWDSAPVETQLILLRFVSEEMLKKNKQLPISERFISACRTNPIYAFDVILKHSSLIKKVFAADASSEAILIDDGECNGEVIELFRHHEYPLMQLIKTYPLLTQSLKDTFFDTKGDFNKVLVEKLNSPDFTWKAFFKFYPSLDAGLKDILFDKKSAFHKKFVSMLVEKMNDSYFASFNANEGGEQTALLQLCKDLEILPLLNKKFKQSHFFMAGLEQKIFDPQAVLTIVKGQKNRKDVETLLAPPKPVQEKKEIVPVDQPKVDVVPDVKETVPVVNSKPIEVAKPAVKKQSKDHVNSKPVEVAKPVEKAPATQSKPVVKKQPEQKKQQPAQEKHQSETQVPPRPVKMVLTRAPRVNNKSRSYVNQIQQSKPMEHPKPAENPKPIENLQPTENLELIAAPAFSYVEEAKAVAFTQVAQSSVVETLEDVVVHPQLYQFALGWAAPCFARVPAVVPVDENAEAMSKPKTK